jgi:ribulose-phosphate 3-epimerase
VTVRIDPSILTADFANLQAEVERVGNADALHVDVMDNHFVPNLTFGPTMVGRLQDVSPVPLDVHLMITDVDRWARGYAELGVFSVTFHAEATDEPVALARKLRQLGARAGLAVKPGTPVEPYLELLPEFDQLLVMTVEPGFGGQAFMRDVLEAKAGPARDILSWRPYGGEVHVDGGINRETIEDAGATGVDIFVVGSALFVKGRDIAREIRLLRALADEGYQYGFNDGVPPIPRDKMVRVASLPKHLAVQLKTAIEGTSVPVVMLRGDGQINPDGVRDYDLLVPATVEDHVLERVAARRDELLDEADDWRRSFQAS